MKTEKSTCKKSQRRFPPMSPKATKAMLCFNPYDHPENLTSAELHAYTGYPKHTLLPAPTGKN